MNSSNEERRFTITLSADEIAFLSNAINEALECIDDWEFETRTGKSRTEANSILARIQRILDESRS